ncbi:hypothetical protein [Croceicoccus sp. BE223]|uniref:hypothetical protein n=1 Tax=Croceicoccus sp. BE223 TaxID=2817716 RepID=UPI00285F1D9E|nr:hypothetical protein [Croceicoccus sp. BE223]MDR7102850.1 hypothetical protein [Croceicoccus sp. BE223]
MQFCAISAGRKRTTGASGVVKGLDELSRKMKELEKAIAALDGEIGTVNFDPNDPQSIEVAIQKMEQTVDERVGDYSRNDMIEGIVSEVKERYRQAILERASEARNEQEGEI